MWSKKRYLKRNVSCDVHLLNELLETDVPWDDAIVVSAGKLRKLWDSLSELRSSVCVKDNWKGQFWGPRYCLSKLCSLLSFFPSGMMSHSKIVQFNWRVYRALHKRSSETYNTFNKINMVSRTHTCWQFITGDTLMNWRQKAKLLQPACLMKCWLQVRTIKTATSRKCMHTHGSHTNQFFYENNTAFVYTQSCMHNMPLNICISKIFLI